MDEAWEFVISCGLWVGGQGGEDGGNGQRLGLRVLSDGNGNPFLNFMLGRGMQFYVHEGISS